jgi:glycosyltransferase involved in cell wall biosynthesis
LNNNVFKEIATAWGRSLQIIAGVNVEFNWPSTLVFDHTRAGDGSATGEVKQSLFGAEGVASMVSVYTGAAGMPCIAFGDIESGGEATPCDSSEELLVVARDAGLEAILYRPTPLNDRLHQLAMDTIKQSGLPFVVWIMDDWLGRLKIEDPGRYETYANDVSWLVRHAGRRLSISYEMSRALESQYGEPFIAVANGVDGADWPERKAGALESASLLIRYAGGLAPEMSLAAIVALAEAVDVVSQRENVRLEINTHHHWLQRYASKFSRFRNVSILAHDHPPKAYRRWLQAADINVLAYNDDEITKTYLKTSLSNKLPECLASGSGILAIGPSDINTLARCDLLPFAYRVNIVEADAIRRQLFRMLSEPEKLKQRGAAGREYALSMFSLANQQQKLRNALTFAPNPDRSIEKVAAKPRSADHKVPLEAPDPIKISVVIPNLNDKTFLEQAILSVVYQEYPNLELIMSDGGSTDGSMEIVEKYAKYFTTIISEPDTGQANAVNKGLACATGEVMGWLNSDDQLMPGSLQLMNQLFSADKKVEWITGRKTMLLDSGAIYQIGEPRPWSWLRFMGGDYKYIQQESTYWRKSLWEKSGGFLDERLRLALDLDLWLRFFEHADLYSVDSLIGAFRKRVGQRSADQRDAYELESLAVLAKTYREISPQIRRRFPVLRSERLTPRNSYDFDRLPKELAVEDPPVIKYVHQQSNFVIPPLKAPPLLLGSDTRQPEVWCDGNRGYDFAPPADLRGNVARSLILRVHPYFPWPFAVEEKPPFSAASPHTMIFAGPVSIYQVGPFRFEVAIKLASGTRHVYLDLPTRAMSAEIAITNDDRGFSVALDGEQVQFFPDVKIEEGLTSLRIGTGHRERFWVGGLSDVEVMFNVSEQQEPWRPITLGLRHARLIRRTRPEAETPLNTTDELIPPYVPGVMPISHFRAKHAGQRCFIMGSGPSLNKMDLSVLEGETVFACNAAFLLLDRIKWRPKYYTCVDSRVLRDRGAQIADMLESNPSMTAFFPDELVDHATKEKTSTRVYVGCPQNAMYFNEVYSSQASGPYGMFSLDLNERVVMPYTVTVTMLQLAVYMGFTEIYLIGCDTNYVVASTVIQSGAEMNGVGLELKSTKDDDPNHFDSSYFGAGRLWHNPQVHNMILHYEYVEQVARELGVDVYNATVGGKLEVFRRKHFGELFPGAVLHDIPDHADA